MSRILALIWLLFALPVAAQELPDWQYNSINDFAGILSNDDTRILDQALIALNGETGVEGTVVTLTDRASYGGTDGLESFATRLFNDWGVGNAERDDGFMVLFLRDDREARIELGAGYAREYDRIAQQIMDGIMLPEFRDGAYSAGLRQGTLAVADRIARAHTAGTVPEPPRRNWADLILVNLMSILFGLFGIVATFLFIYRKWTQNRCPRCRERGLITETGPMRDPLPDGGWKVQYDQVKRICPSCGYTGTKRKKRPETIVFAGDGTILSRSSNIRSVAGRSRSSGGFGGGSSGGGGASGRW
ncbi:TPM domain-containing protein [Paracoccus aerodenitrificans]|uniref:TPM domain-containing protein n=1 Tax=Paracoccus aerodenitrificans TaxID=3017781 RepID=UPI0022F0211C|nr:TPM domain-containing protein [Paracoccus aerodenitrificans]WBU63350.1 TPM domain-containing protein [Paracoccus aerodenitrificans]